MNELTVIQAIEKRRSTKHFTREAIPPTVLNALVDAAAEAASSWNLQPWRIVLVRDEEQRKALAAVAWNQPQILEAPVTFVFAVSLQGWRRTMSRTIETAEATGAWGDKMVGMLRAAAPGFQEALGPRLREFAAKDAMIAATHVALAAESLGLGSCFMNGWVEDGVKRVIGAEGDGDIAVAVVLPVGYAAETPKHPGRLPRGLTFFEGRLDAPYRFVAPPELRSPREKALGLVHLPRLIDKVRLAARGALPGYNYLATGMDKRLLEFLDVKPEAFEAAVRGAADDGAVYRWLEANARKADDAAKREFNEGLMGIGPTDPDRAARFRLLLDSVDPSRTDVKTFMELIDLLEGRI